jgi:hypothetical protein
MRIPPEERAKSYREWLMRQPNRARLIALRKEGAMNRKKVLAGIKRVVERTQATYPKFKGILIWGSFARGKRFPNDIDFLPVLNHPFTELPTGKEGGYSIQQFFTEFSRETGKPCHTGAGDEFYISTTNDKNLMRSIEFFTQYYTKLQGLREWNFIGDPTTKATLTRAIQKARGSKKFIPK